MPTVKPCGQCKVDCKGCVHRPQIKLTNQIWGQLVINYAKKRRFETLRAYMIREINKMFRG